MKNSLPLFLLVTFQGLSRHTFLQHRNCTGQDRAALDHIGRTCPNLSLHSPPWIETAHLCVCLIHSFHRYLLSTRAIPGTVPDAANAAINKTDKVPLPTWGADKIN